jgi:hypothetical protein
MQYMLMCCFDEALWTALPEAQKDKVMQEYGEVIRTLMTSGQCRASVKLQPSSSSTTIREQNGKPVIIDGPFAESKELLGGYHLVECKDLDEAIAIAERIPTLRVGGTIEVRPVESISER